MASIRALSAGTALRLIAYIINTIICCSYGTLVSLPLAALGYRRLAQWTAGKLYAFMVRTTIGVSFRIIDPHGYLNIRPALFLTNHQTELDILMMSTALPKWCVVACKSSLKHIPFLGWYLMASGTVFIDKDNLRIARGAMENAVKDIVANKISIFAFPEGTRSYAKEPSLLPFKKGAFHLAVQAKVPIIPLVCANYSDMLSYKDLRFTGGVVPVKVLKPIETSTLTAGDVEDLMRDTRELMLKEVLALGRDIGKNGLPKDVNPNTEEQEIPVALLAEEEAAVERNKRGAITTSQIRFREKPASKL